MARVAVAHTDLTARGGAEAVCVNVLEALQDHHDVTLFTLVDPDWPALNEFYNADVRDVERRFGRERFRAAIRAHVDDVLRTATAG